MVGMNGLKNKGDHSGGDGGYLKQEMASLKANTNSKNQYSNVESKWQRSALGGGDGGARARGLKLDRHGLPLVPQPSDHADDPLVSL